MRAEHRLGFADTATPRSGLELWHNSASHGGPVNPGGPAHSKQAWCAETTRVTTNLYRAQTKSAIIITNRCSQTKSVPVGMSSCGKQAACCTAQLPSGKVYTGVSNCNLACACTPKPELRRFLDAGRPCDARPATSLLDATASSNSSSLSIHSHLPRTRHPASHHTHTQ
jgi:hypothetical protein